MGTSDAPPPVLIVDHFYSFGCVVCSFIEPDIFDNNVPFDITTPIYLINLLWKLGLGLGLDLELHYFRIFHGE